MQKVGHNTYFVEIGIMSHFFYSMTGPSRLFWLAILT